MASIGMAFAGLTSGYVVAKGSLEAKNIWQTIDLPMAFYFSTLAILLSSALLILGQRQFARKSGISPLSYLKFSLVLGIAFVVFQVMGWQELMSANIWFTGPNSTPAGSWLYVITWFHWMHALAGVIVLAITTWRAQRGSYNVDSHLGYDLAGQFWHFLGILWIYLLLFLAILR
ncbi:MAG: cytochrome c oxidase subunit 3 [Schleiferiaceae bacterium]|nr:cytochrome c oxidase subunit 3 [Schleiferiaceae bacterium]